MRSTTGDLVTNVAYDYEGPNLWASFDATGIATKLFLYEGVDLPLRFAVDAGGTFSTPDSGPGANVAYAIFYYELDLAGNVRRVRDATGADLGGYRYTAFGQTLPADASTPAPGSLGVWGRCVHVAEHQKQWWADDCQSEDQPSLLG